VFWFEDIYSKPRDRADADRRHVARRPARPRRQDRRDHRRVPVRGPLLPVHRDARRRHPDRRRHVGRASTRIARSAATRRSTTSASSCPVLERGARSTRAPAPRASRTGAHDPCEEGLGAQPRDAGAGPVALHAADQHADLRARAQSRSITPSTSRATSCRTSTRS
jgi:hypothetical protein